MYAAPSSNGPKAGGSEMEDFLLGKKNVDDLLRNKAANETVSAKSFLEISSFSNPIILP